MDPYFVAQVLAPRRNRGQDHAVLLRWVRPSASSTADQVKQAMLAVVQSGTGTDAPDLPASKSPAKTGSAETGGTNVNSMFVGFAPYDSPTVAISRGLEVTTSMTPRPP